MCVPTKYVSHSKDFLPRMVRCLSSAWVKRGKVDSNVFCIANTRHSEQGVEFKYANKRGVARA